MKKYLKPVSLLTQAAALFALSLFLGCQPQSTTSTPPDVSLHEAAMQGDLEIIQQHLAAGTDLNERDPLGGASPLITAAAFGQTEAARALIEAGAELDIGNNEGSTALHTAAFLCHTEIVELLLAHGADRDLRNKAGATALESVTPPFEAVQGIYDMLDALLFIPVGQKLDYDRIRATRPQMVELLR